MSQSTVPESKASTASQHRSEWETLQSGSGMPSADHLAGHLRGKLSQMASGDLSDVEHAAKIMDAATVVVHAMRELSRISGLPADHVSSVVHEADGWHVTVDLIELRRIPHSTDVMAAYDAVFAPDGSLRSYRRRRRYMRDQMSEDAS